MLFVELRIEAQNVMLSEVEASRKGQISIAKAIRHAA
jgi:hypothetical protein